MNTIGLMSLSILILASCSEKRMQVQEAPEATKEPDLSIKGLNLKPYSEIETRPELIENVKRIGYCWSEKKMPVSMRQWKHYCGEPDGISTKSGDGDDAIMLYFYEREDIHKTWVTCIVFRDGLLTTIGLNDATANSYEDFSILNERYSEYK